MSRVENLPSAFDLPQTRLSAAGLPSRAWMYLKKLHERREQGAERERRGVLESVAQAARTSESLARELGLLAHEILRLSARASEPEGRADALRHLAVKAAAALRRAHVELEDPTGAPLDGALAERCQVIHNVPREGVRGHVVGETLAPGVRLSGRSVHLAEVIGWVPVAEPSAPNDTGESSSKQGEGSW